MLGIFDSGLGGLTVVKSILDRYPGRDILYFGDTARVPYGSKSPATITRYAEENCKLLLEQGADHIVIACHSAASVAGEYVRKIYQPVGIKVWDVAREGLDEVLKKTQGQIGLIGTRASINSGFHKKYLLNKNPRLKIIGAACPLLVSLVEEGYDKEPETKTILKKYLEPLLKQKIDTLVLGCTHYPLLRDQIEQIVPPTVTIIDPAESLAEHLNAERSNDVKEQKGRIKLIFSDDSPIIPEMLTKVFGKTIPYQLLINSPLA